MSDGADHGFGRRTVAGLIAAGVLLAVAFVVLGVAAPAWREGGDGGTHALSKSGTGFAGVVALARATGLPVHLSRGGAEAGLLVLTPGPGTDPGEIVRLIRAHDNRPVLIVLPKWDTKPVDAHPGWVERIDRLAPVAQTAPLAELIPRDSRPFAGARSFRPLDFNIGRSDGSGLLASRDRAIAGGMPVSSSETTIAGTALQPVLVDASGAAVLAWLPVRNTYILADADVLDNAALASPAAARAALRLLRDLGGSSGAAFDLTLAGFARPYDLARLALTPPFLGVTLCLAAAALLAGAAAAQRFGAPQPGSRVLPFGTATLVDNAAALIRTAKREPAALARYADATVEAAAARLNAPAGLAGIERVAWFTGRGGAGARLAPLLTAAADATDRAAVLAAARTLFIWHKEIVDDRR